MQRLLTAIAVLIVAYASHAYGQRDSKADVGTGEFLLRYCQDPKYTGICNFYLFGYTQGLNDGRTRTDRAWSEMAEYCRKGERKFCDAPPGSVVDIEYLGCNREAQNLPQSAIQQILISSLARNPSRRSWDLGSIYRKAIEEAFPCK